MAKKPSVYKHAEKVVRNKDKILDSLRTKEEEIAVKGLLFTGMRVGEFVHSRRKWIERKKNPPKYFGLIRIPRSMKCGCSECKRKRNGVWKVKTENSARIIPVVEEAKFLMDFFENHKKMMELFPYRERVNNILKRIDPRVKGVRLFPHAFRGAFATILGGKGVNTMQVKDILGWSALKTANKYVKLSGRQVIEAIEENW